VKTGTEAWYIERGMTILKLEWELHGSTRQR
jgi:hypothetical protein